MALTLSWPTPYGHTFTQAHAVIQDARLEKVESQTYPVNYKVKIWINETAYNDGASFISGFNGRFEIDTAGSKNQYNIVKQCYINLKLQEGWTDATDC
tara:strand:+ start:2089 stop:2382 length:294 start_codon:yes stop_codon:yes gene_type:complete